MPEYHTEHDRSSAPAEARDSTGATTVFLEDFPYMAMNSALMRVPGTGEV